MSSRRPDAAPSAPRPDRSRRIARACTAELRAHIVIFATIVLPILVLGIPAFLWAFGVYFLGYMAAEPMGLGERLTQFASEHWTALCLGSSTLMGSIGVRAAYLAIIAEVAKDVNFKSPPGPKGEVLRACVTALWERFGAPNRPAPGVVLNADLNVVARAFEFRGRQEIQVSGDLWNLVVQGEPVTEVILTHEIAHLVHRDPIVFRALTASVSAARTVLRFTLYFCAVTVILIIGQQLAVNVAGSANVWNIVARLTTIVAVSCLTLVALLLGEMTVRRYAGFIISLGEIRADVSAALWGVGLDHFACLLENTPGLHRSTPGDIWRSLYSLNLTHISETERLDLLRSTDRLITPKLRYFALSLALPFLFPLNSITPLIFGGSIDHLLMTSAVVVLQAATISMIILAGGTATLSWRRAFLLGVALCVAMSLPRINLYTVGYFLTHETLSIGYSPGFGSEPASLARVGEDLRVTLSDLAHKSIEAIGSGWVIPSVAVAGLALRLLSALAGRLAEHSEAVGLPVTLTVMVTCFVAAISSYDPWRDEFFASWPLSMAKSWSAWTEPFPCLRLCGPGLSALAVWSAHYLFMFLVRLIAYDRA